MPAFTNCNIAMVGTFKGRKQANIQSLITSNGGSYNVAIAPGTTTHLITNETDVAKKGPKVKPALDKSNKILIVGIEWLDECIKEDKKVDEADYLIKTQEEEEKDEDTKAAKDQDGDVEMANSQASNGSGLRRSSRSKASPAPQAQATAAATATTAAAPAPVAGRKRGRPAKQETVKEEPEKEEEEEKKDKDQKAAVKDKDNDTEMKDVDEEEKPAKRARGKKGVAALPAPDAVAPKPTAPVAAPAPAPPPTAAAPAPAPAKRGRGAKKTDPAPAAAAPAAPAPAPVAAAPAPAPAAAAPATNAKAPPPPKKGRGKKKEPSPPPAEDESEEEKPAVKMKTVKMAKGTAPVDEHFPIPAGWSVYVDPQGVIYDGSLNQTDIGKNSNKFYYVQLLENKSSGYATWTRWGRVGEAGQMAMVAAKGSPLSTAMAGFEKKFKDKSGLTWANRLSTPKNGKYTYVLKNYASTDDEDSDEEEEEDVKGKGKGKEKKKDAEANLPPPDSKLHERIQALMGLIFNNSFMQQQMMAMSYDASKLPLGKLSKTTINQGFLALKAIGELINDATLAQSVHRTGLHQAFVQLTNRYYSVIPHAFGRNVPPVIDNGQKLKKEVELIESLGDMKIATEVLKDTSGVPRDKNGNRIHPIDKQYESLDLLEATPLDKSTDEFKNLEGYLKRTHGKTHYMTLQVEDIFRIERQGETQRFIDEGYSPSSKTPQAQTDNRYLLWHGSRVTNFAGILSQGLRIAPPEAPVNGYMFGKGIYLADMVTKSANYCCAYQSDRTGLLMLCEAQLGDPMYECVNSDYNAAKNSKSKGALATKGRGKTAPVKWMDAGAVHEDLKGVKMPDVEADVGDVDNSLYLQYNEYIVYNVAQVKIKYLFRCKFN